MKRVVLGMAAIAAAVVAPQAAGAQAASDVTLVHGVPGVPVDVVVDGTVVIDNFAPGSLANISSFAGQTLTNVQVLDDPSGDVLIEAPALVIPDSGSHSNVPHYNESNVPVLTQFENNTAAVAEGQARLSVRHTAAAGPIDVISGDSRPVTNLANGQNVDLVQPVGNFSGEVATAGGDPIPGVDPISIDLAADTNTVLFAVGSSDDAPDFIVQVVNLETTDESTTTTTDPNATTTTTDPNATTTTSTSTTSTSTTTTAAVPTAVNTGSPLDGDSNTLLIVVALGGLALAGTAMVARRRT